MIRSGAAAAVSSRTAGPVPMLRAATVTGARPAMPAVPARCQLTGTLPASGAAGPAHPGRARAAMLPWLNTGHHKNEFLAPDHRTGLSPRYELLRLGNSGPAVTVAQPKKIFDFCFLTSCKEHMF